MMIAVLAAAMVWQTGPITVSGTPTKTLAPYVDPLSAPARAAYKRDPQTFCDGVWVAAVQTKGAAADVDFITIRFMNAGEPIECPRPKWMQHEVRGMTLTQPMTAGQPMPGIAW